MSSNPSQEYIDPITVAMLRDVLRTAGLRGVEAEASSDAKREAQAFLKAEFRNGNRTKASLLRALQHREKNLTSVPRANGSWKDPPIYRSHDEGSH